jgi:dihydroflavonol-4-reductase
MDDIFLGKTILVTGATGSLGGAVAKALLQEGYQVRAMARNLQRAQSLACQGAEVVQADMIDLPSLDRAVSGCQVVLHFAGVLVGEFASLSYFHQVNVEGTLHLAQAALEAGVERFLNTSTAWVYGFAASLGTTERSPYRISNDPYIDTKIEAERRLQRLCLERSLPLVTVQPSQVYGPGERHWTLSLLRYIQTGKMMMIDGGSGLIQPTYMDDIVAGILAALRRGRIGEAYLLCGSEEVTLRRYLAELAHILGRKQIPSIPRGLAMTLAVFMESLSALTHRPPMLFRAMVRASTMHATYDGSKARAELGFIPQVCLSAGMDKVAAWLEAEKPLGS